jgi:sugar phosphate isomerase/epimerase
MLALQNHPPVVDNGDDMLRMVQEVGSPSLQACFDAPLARRQGVVDMRAALLDVGSRQVLSHFGGEYDRGADGQVRGYVREPDGSLTPESFYGEFARGLAEIGYDGYIGYELCHPLPMVDGRTVGIEFADMNARLAAEYMRAVLNDARTLAGNRAATGR